MTITLPARPRDIPALVVEPGSIRTTGTRLLAASAQVDDAGTYAAGPARVGDWTGDASTRYHDGVRPLGRRADAMSLALRGVAHRVDDHADVMERLVTQRIDLDERRRHLVQQIAVLRAEAAEPMTADEQQALQQQCDGVQREVTAFETDLSAWHTARQEEEQAMVTAFERVLELDAVDRRYGGQPDPADDALATKPPAGAPPSEVNRWWKGLTEAQQQAILAAAPGAIGNLDGIPAAARDAANTVRLERDLADWEHTERQGVLTDDERKWLENARAAEDALDSGEDRLDPVTGEPIPLQLWLYDPSAFGGDGRVAIAAGDLDTADNVATITPGFLTDATSIPTQLDKALNVHEASRFLDPSASNATLAWIGYDAPDNAPWDEGWDGAGVVREDLAVDGGERLADAIDGLRATRPDDPAHMTAIGHSYGSATLGRGAHDEGLAVDDIVVTGSPGLGGDTHSASDLNLDPDHVWVGRNSQDFVAGLADNGWVNLGTLGGSGLGDDPAADDFGANRFQAESTGRDDEGGIDSHNGYYEHDTESLSNIAHVVNGQYDQVAEAGHTTDPWWRSADDPEKDRTPTSPDTDGR